MDDMAAKTETSLDVTPPQPGFTGVDVNLKGVYYTCYLALHYFRLPPPANATPFKRSLVIVSSLAEYLGYPYSTTYSMFKFGVRGILYGLGERKRSGDPCKSSNVSVHPMHGFSQCTPNTKRVKTP
jgi:5'-hydroxyaverantin dehydrogenase